MSCYSETVKKFIYIFIYIHQYECFFFDYMNLMFLVRTLNLSNQVFLPIESSIKESRLDHF